LTVWYNQIAMPSTRAIVTYRPDTDEERLIALLGRKLGLNKSRIIGLALRQMAERERVDNEVRLSAEEQALLDSLNKELSPAFWQRYHQLAGRELDGADRTEFLALIEKTEAWNVRRLELLEELAQRRGMHFPALMQALGIRHHPYA
jgi:hypothetical protein